MHRIEKNLDKEIEFHENQIEEIKKAKLELEKKMEGFEMYLAGLDDIKESYKITEQEIFEFRASEIESWVLKLIKEDSDSTLHTKLLNHFKKVLKNKPKRKVKAKKPKTIKADKADKDDSPSLSLPVGNYTNPFTLESINKSTKTPALLIRWVEEYGLAGVKSWLNTEEAEKDTEN